jgi:hypothetical protein
MSEAIDAEQAYVRLLGAQPQPLTYHVVQRGDSLWPWDQCRYYVGNLKWTGAFSTFRHYRFEERFPGGQLEKADLVGEP